VSLSGTSEGPLLSRCCSAAPLARVFTLLLRPERSAVQSESLDFTRKQERCDRSGLVEASHLSVDSSVVASLVRELADDGKVSPVDIGTSVWALSEVVADHSSLSARQYLDRGGLAALLSTYLERSFLRFPREREGVGRALLQLIDLETQKRVAEGRTATQLWEATRALEPESLAAALEFLASRQGRVLEKLSPTGSPPRYRLIHERLIPAVRRVAGPYIHEQEQARSLLERAFASWALDRDRKYLLSGRDLKRVRACASEMRLGEGDSEKRKFIALSQRQHLFVQGGRAGGSLLLATGLWWLLGTTGEAAGRNSLLNAWGLPQDLEQALPQLEALGLPPQVSTLAWLKHASSLHTLSIAGTEIKDLADLPKTVTTLIMTGLPAKPLPPAVNNLVLVLTDPTTYARDPLLSGPFPAVDSITIVTDDTLPFQLNSRACNLVMEHGPLIWSQFLPSCLRSFEIRRGAPTSLPPTLPPLLKWLILPDPPDRAIPATPASFDLDVWSGSEFHFTLSTLPRNTTGLRWFGEGLDLTAIPRSVERLSIDLSQVGALNWRELPPSIKMLCLDMQYQGLPRLRALSTLPSSVRKLRLKIESSQVQGLKDLPPSIESLALTIGRSRSASVSSLTLPRRPRVVFLDIEETEIKELKGLPDSVEELVLPSKFKTLQGLPKNVRRLSFGNPPSVEAASADLWWYWPFAR